MSFPKISHYEAVVNTPLGYYRFHGVPKLVYSSYEENFMDSVFRQIKENPLSRTAYVYFNNTASMAALHNARYFKQLVAEYLINLPDDIPTAVD